MNKKLESARAKMTSRLRDAFMAPMTTYVCTTDEAQKHASYLATAVVKEESYYDGARDALREIIKRTCGRCEKNEPVEVHGGRAVHVNKSKRNGSVTYVVCLAETAHLLSALYTKIEYGVDGPQGGSVKDAMSAQEE